MERIQYSKADKYNVLVFPAGAENRMDIYDSLRQHPNFEVYGASSKIDHAFYIYPKDRYYVGNLNIAEESFIESFNSLLSYFQIDFVIPTHDVIAAYLMKEEKFINARILCSPYETAKIAENKRLTADLLKSSAIYPKVYEGINDVDEFPVFLKPYIGAGSRGIHLVHDKETLSEIIAKEKDLLISEYLPGKEYTVGCFTDRKGNLLFVGPSTRERIISGRSFHSDRAPMDGGFRKIAEELNNILEFRGSWFFQVKEDKNGELKLLEFSVRQIGEMALYRQLGVNFAAMSIADALDQDVEVIFNDFELQVDLSYRNNYFLDLKYGEAYIALEDTLITKEKLNMELLLFIYQCIENKVSTTLLINGRGTYDDMLKEYPLSDKLFTRVIDLKEHKEIKSCIEDTNAIFISSNIKDRLSIKESRGIPVFDLDAVEGLIGRGI